MEDIKKLEKIIENLNKDSIYLGSKLVSAIQMSTDFKFKKTDKVIKTDNPYLIGQYELHIS